MVSGKIMKIKIQNFDFHDCQLHTSCLLHKNMVMENKGLFGPKSQAQTLTEKALLHWTQPKSFFTHGSRHALHLGIMQSYTPFHGWEKILHALHWFASATKLLLHVLEGKWRESVKKHFDPYAVLSSRTPLPFPTPTFFPSLSSEEALKPQEFYA